MEDGNRQRLADLGAIELVIDAMRQHMSPAPAGGAGGGGRVQKDAIVALRHLAYENDASKKRVLDAGGVDAVVAAIEANGGRHDVLVVPQAEPNQQWLVGGFHGLRPRYPRGRQAR